MNDEELRQHLIEAHDHRPETAATKPREEMESWHKLDHLGIYSHQPHSVKATE